MINPTREEVAVALFGLLNTAPMQAIFNTISRRPQLFTQCANKPGLYMGSPKETYVYEHGTVIPGKISLDYVCYLYIDSGLDPDAVPDTLLNNLLDAVEAAIAPTPPLPAGNGRQSLGGIVDHAWIEGDVNRAPGWLDGEGMAIFTIRVLVPSSG